MPRRALVVLSGGQDSTTCLYVAKRDCGEVHALTFNYGQRHAIEIESARRVAQMAGVASHEVLSVPSLKGTSPLTDHARPVGHYERAADMPGGVEPTFVPGRNLLFVALATNRAAVLECDDVYMGVSQEDYGGYPDCRQEFITAADTAMRRALGRHIRLLTPLLYLNKTDTVLLAVNLPGCMEALAYSHTCYDGAYPPNPRNHASILRARGFHRAHVADPLILRAKAEGKLPASYPDDGLVVE